MKKNLWFLSLLLAWLMLMPYTVYAASPTPPSPPNVRNRPSPRRITGKVLEIDSEHLLLAGKRGQVIALTLTEETRFFVPDTISATYSDIPTGTRIHVVLHQTREEAIARAVILVPEETASLQGQIISIQENSFTVETPLGQQITITVNAATRYIPPRSESGEVYTLQDLQPLTSVSLTGKWEDMESFHAWLVRLKPASHTRRIRGVVLAYDEALITLGTREGILHVQINEQTLYSPSQSDESLPLQNGMPVVILAEGEGETLTARRVILPPSP